MKGGLLAFLGTFDNFRQFLEIALTVIGGCLGEMAGERVLEGTAEKVVEHVAEKRLRGDIPIYAGLVDEFASGLGVTHVRLALHDAHQRTHGGASWRGFHVLDDLGHRRLVPTMNDLENFPLASTELLEEIVSIRRCH